MIESRFAILIPLFLLAACGASPHVLVTGLTDDFESSPAGALPKGFHSAETNGAGKPARWQVLPEGGGGSAQRLAVATENAGDTFNLLMSDATLPADLRITLTLRADAGEEDQGGGVLWRGQGPDDYYCARWNPLEDNVRIYTVKGGVRSQLATAKVTVPPAQWHTFDVKMVGDLATVAFDGKTMFEVRDSTFAAPGHIGFWTKADASVSFDELRVTDLTGAR